MPFYTDLLAESPSDTFTKSDWKEAIETTQPGGGEAFSLESGEAVIVVEIPWLKARSFIRFTLGWSYADNGSPYRLRRENPQAHPRFPWLTASTVSFGSVSPVGVAGVGTKVDGIYTGDVPVAKYARILATVRFVDRPWQFLTDADASTPARESLRNTYFDLSPSIEVLSAEGLNNIKFAFSPGPPTGPPNTAIPAPFGTLMSKVNYSLNWMWVPQEYISNGTVFYPTKIMSCVGRVNSADFKGFPAGTLLLQAPTFQRFRFPLPGVTPFDNFFGYNIRFPLQYFDPTRGPVVGGPTPPLRGHQLIPWRSTLQWFGCLREDGTSRLYPEADFATLFTHVDAP